jgi:colicin import membrane protein
LRDPFAQGLSRSLGISLGAHLLVGAVLTLKAFLFPSEPLRIESAIRVDIVGLPDKSPQLPTAPPPPQAEAPPPPPPPAQLPPRDLAPPPPPPPAVVVLKPTPGPTPKERTAKELRQDQSAALKKLEAIAKLERQARADAAAKAAAAMAQARPLQGNQVSRGGSLSGLTRLDHDTYLSTLEQKIRTAWRPPKYLAKNGLKVKVLVHIDAQGAVIKKAILQSSGNPVFDESALQAIDSIAPFPQPPSSLAGLLLTSGLLLDLEPTTTR